MIRRSVKYFNVLILMSFCGVGLAQTESVWPLMNSGGGSPAGAHFVAQRIPEPPQAALDACNNLTANSSCTFTINGHQIEGTCRKSSNGNVLACAPKGMPPPPPPPQAAVDACNNLTVDSSCTFTIKGHQIEGTCRENPNGAALVCAPQGMPPPPSPPQAALDICKNLSVGTACMFTIDDHQIEGICRSFPNSDIIACAPSSMPIPPGNH